VAPFFSAAGICDREMIDRRPVPGGAVLSLFPDHERRKYVSSKDDKGGVRSSLAFPAPRGANR
jgi:hypothetical protein